MQLLELTLDLPAENLALDEALLDSAEIDSSRGEILRLWEPTQTMVVAGSSSRLADEVNLEACRQRGVPVLRRTSGGATIVTGPGCLMYAVVLSYQHRPELRAIDRAHHFVLDTIAAALNALELFSANVPKPRDQRSRLYTADSPPYTVSRAGTSDLVLGDKKFSGNSLRCKRNHFLYHGTLLYDFPLEQISELLKLPARQPAYRAHRSHADFVTNLPLDAAALRQSLISAFSATEPYPAWPRALTTQLAAEKYVRPEWAERA